MGHRKFHIRNTNVYFVYDAVWTSLCMTFVVVCVAVSGLLE